MADRSGRRRRRYSDPFPSYFLDGYGLTPEEKDRWMAFFAYLKERYRWKPPKPPAPSDDKPEVPKPELAKKLHVTGIDFHVEENTKSHHTSDYECTKKRTVEGKAIPRELVIRRGESFKMTINFDRPYDIKKNDITLIFKLGSDSGVDGKIKEKLVLQESKPDKIKKNKWSAYLVEKKDKSLTVSVFVPAKTNVGEWEVVVRTIVDVKDGKDIIWQYLHNQEVTILFNPWCKQDLVYMEDETWMKEAVLNDDGGIFVGNAHWWSCKEWFFGQYEDGILDISLHLLRRAFKFSTSAPTGNVIRVVRALSAIVNSNDDNGVLSGNWSGEYEGGISPTEWIGSVKILKKYAETKRPVKYGQCWVFSGVLTTVCRALGIPCRSVTNFESAHNSDSDHLSCDVINRLNYKGKWEENKIDSVWNFHVWNEAWINRPDLQNEGGKNYNGWQVIDATPQERSDGIFQCGPSPLQAIKEGELNIGSDTAFIFAEVNCDKVEWIEHPKTKVLYELSRETNAVGKKISTHKPTGEPVRNSGREERLDITNLYKHEEDSKKEREIVKKAERLFRSDNNDDENYVDVAPPVVDLEVKIDVPEDNPVGKPVPIVFTAENKGRKAYTINLSMDIDYVDYTRDKKDSVVEDKKSADIKLAPQQKTQLKYEVDVKSSMKLPQFDFLFLVHGVMKIKELEFPMKSTKFFMLTKPRLQVTAPDKGELGKNMEVVVKLTNPLDFPLTNALLTMEGGLKPVDDITEIKIGNIKAKENWSKKVTVIPSESGYGAWRSLSVELTTKELGTLSGYASITLPRE